ncbi:MAG: PEP/pyruvate-binding domain-containing protein [bacterium]
MTSKKSIETLVSELQERAKELNCLYRVEEIIGTRDLMEDDILQSVVYAIPHGWQYADICCARILCDGHEYLSPDFTISPWFISSHIVVQDEIIGNLTVYYKEDRPNSVIGPFLREEKKLLDTIADRIGHFILHRRLRNVFKELDTNKFQETEEKDEWRIVLEMIRKTDPNLFMSLLRKLLHQLIWSGIEEADILLKQSGSSRSGDEANSSDENRPLKKRKIENFDEYVESIFNLVSQNLDHEIVFAKIQKWIQEDRNSALVKVVENQDTSLAEVGDAIRRYFHMAPEKFEFSPSTIKGLRVSLLRRFFSDDLDYISMAKDYVKLTDFYKLIDRMIYPPESHGKLGGKSAGLFLSGNILRRCAEENLALKDIKIPKTWYITSDGILNFMQYNNLEEVLEQKYKDIDEVRLEYPQIVQLFKNSEFSPDIIKGVSVALDDFGDKPLVVRSSSLLEDQVGAAFSGKYKSLFLANQGNKQERINALLDAIAEVYSSVFGPDPIEYRAERGLTDFHEEMGIMIQEVVGTKIGNYFLPTFAGVAFSNNEFRWSSRIKREDGLVRIVPGLGTRAVDRVSDDFPVMLAPGQPNLQVNVTLDEKIYYSPKKIDVINLKTNQFETMSIQELLKECGENIPGINNVISIVSGDHIRQPIGLDTDFHEDDIIVTFEGLVTKTNFVKLIHTILKTLEVKMKMPVDIEFASDGKDFYLLQCRSQSNLKQHEPDPIPKDVAHEKIIFTANKYVSNGKVGEISHIVYVDPFAYGEITDRQKMLHVGRAVGRLNKILPKRKFIMLGPGRWGSRGDIKLGVSVTYSDISNTAMLIEVARKKGNYVPDLSFGTHFFQDLVEASIRYLPLYPDDEGIIFNEKFFKSSKNILTAILPDFAHVADTVKVIDVVNSTGGDILKVLMNAELEEALALITKPSVTIDQKKEQISYSLWEPTDYWRWRYNIAEKIASEIDPDKFGVKGFYIFGSTKNANAGPGSDIDILLHIHEDKEKNDCLRIWIDGWSKCLAEMNYLRTGYKSDGLLDVHYVTDEDIQNKTAYAIKIDAITDAARPLEMKKKS